MRNDLLIDIELKLYNNSVSLEQLQDVLSGDTPNNETAKYVRDLIINDVVTKEQVSNLVSKHYALQENATAKLIERFGE